MPELYFVMRHSGRDGEPWRVIFESRSRAEAEAVYHRKIPRKWNKAVACTTLCHGGLLWDHQVQSDGLAPRKIAIGVEGAVKAAHAREEREARAAARATRKAAIRIAEPAELPSLAYATFRRSHPATRHFQRYTSEQRATHAASHRTGRRQREAVGEFFYTHEMAPGQAFTTAKAATKHAFAIFVASARIAIEPAPIERLRIALAPDLKPEVAIEQGAEDEALAGGHAIIMLAEARCA